VTTVSILLRRRLPVRHQEDIRNPPASSRLRVRPFTRLCALLETRGLSRGAVGPGRHVPFAGAVPTGPASPPCLAQGSTDAPFTDAARSARAGGPLDQTATGPTRAQPPAAEAPK